VNKVRTSLHSKCYQLSGMLIHHQNSYAPRIKWDTSHHEVQNHRTGQQSQNPPCMYMYTYTDSYWKLDAWERDLHLLRKRHIPL
jgi:hypothetical protein